MEGFLGEGALVVKNQELTPLPTPLPTIYALFTLFTSPPTCIDRDRTSLRIGKPIQRCAFIHDINFDRGTAYLAVPNTRFMGGINADDLELAELVFH